MPSVLEQPKTTQMNTRIDAGLKQRGDRALAQAGYSPSQAVRKLWEFADNHRNDPQAIRGLFSSSGSSISDQETERRKALYEQALKGPSILRAAYKKAGISLKDSPLSNFSYAELRERALMDKYYGDESL